MQQELNAGSENQTKKRKRKRIEKKKKKKEWLTQGWLPVVGGSPVTHLMMTLSLLFSAISHFPEAKEKDPEEEIWKLWWQAEQRHNIIEKKLQTLAQKGESSRHGFQ